MRRRTGFQSNKARGKVAEKARANDVLSDTDIEPLLQEIAKNPLYKSRHAQQEPYDGV